MKCLSSTAGLCAVETISKWCSKDRSRFCCTLTQIAILLNNTTMALIIRLISPSSWRVRDFPVYAPVQSYSVRSCTKPSLSVGSTTISIWLKTFSFLRQLLQGWSNKLVLATPIFNITAFDLPWVICNSGKLQKWGWINHPAPCMCEAG